MASNNDSAGKGPPKPVPEAPRKPTAVIDLKATEVGIATPASEPAKAAATVAAAAAKASSTEGTATSPNPTAGDKPSVPSTAASTAAGTGAKPASSPAATPQAASATTLPPKAASGGGVRSAATHLVAGLAGGLLALLGAEQLLPKHVQPGGDAGRLTQEVENRLRNLEVAAARPLAPEVAQRIAAAEERLATIDRLARAAAEQSTQVAGETKAIGERLAAQPQAGAGAPDERLARLEEILNTLATANAGDPQRGRIPQLAGISAKLVDLESSVATQVAQLRKSVTQEVDSRLAQSSDAAQAARTGTQRLDRELAGLKTEAAQLTTRLEGFKAQADRLDAGVKGLREDTAGLKAELGSVREEVSRELRQMARPTDVTTALSPVASKLAALEQNVQGVVRGEDDRRANVERIVMALELGNLKRTIERGAAFGNELAEVRRVAGPKLDLSVLERYRDRGVPALGELERDFRSLAFRIIDADQQPVNAHWTDRLIASAKSVVRVRKIDQGADEQGVEATVSRIEQGIKGGRLVDVLKEAGKLSEQARAPARAWLEKVEARAAVERAIGVIELELKASLGAASQSGKKG